MARTRNIKPSFFKDDRIAELDCSDRLLFIGLWTLADCFGRMEYRPKRIKVELMPYDQVDIEESIESLRFAGLIDVYHVDDLKYLSIIDFNKHQSPHKNEIAAGGRVPAPQAEIVKSKPTRKPKRPRSKVVTSLFDDCGMGVNL